VIFFGGEWMDPVEDGMYVYADCYIFNAQSCEWKQIVSPNGPLPRSSHQSVTTRGYMYVFGGEFTSRDSTKFRHFGDTWRLDLSTYVWEQIASKGPGTSPSARSGHRMVAYKNVIVLFGGFADTGKTTRYHADVWLFSFDTLAWEEKKVGGSPPSPRGGCQLALHKDTLFVIGGYSTAKKISNNANRGNARDDDDDDEKGIVHDDIFALDLINWTWEKVKKQGMVPTARSSFGLAVHAPKAKAVLFGGVFDQDGGGDKMYSELFNEAYQFNMESRRWFPLSVRPPKAKGKGKDGAESAAAAESNAGANVPAQEDRVDPATARAATLIQAAFRGYAVRKAYETYRVGGKISELLYSPATYGIDWDSKELIRPRARSAPSLFVLKNTLWLWGGMVEIEHADVVLDDMWCLDLNKLDCWHCMKENSTGEEAFRELSSDDDDNDDMVE
jgi:N-acetylneuraminic acid mutarotase